jgi:serine/threonine protein kinase
MVETTEFEEENNSNTISLPRSEQPEIVDKFYKVSVTEPVTELNNDLCKYYIARHIDTNEEFYAIAFEKHNSSTIAWLGSLKNIHAYPIVTPITYGVTRITSLKEEYLVVIIKKYDFRHNLMQRIVSRGPMSYEEITEQIIAPIAHLLQFCEKSNLEIGNFSPNNIIFTSDNRILCREFFTSPPHYFQDSYLLAPEIANAIPYGRVTGKIQADIYALGIIIIFALTGSQPWTKYPEQQYDLIRLESGSFTTFASKIRIEPDFKNLIKGILFDNPSERWKVRNILDWINGKATKAVSTDNFDAISPIVFNDANFQNCRALAYSMHSNWDNALLFMKEERLTKWVQRSLIKTKLTEAINEIFSEQASFKYSYNQDRDENLYKLLVAFDPYAPMRLKNFIATVLSIPNIICASLINRRNDHLEAILKILNKKFWSIGSDKSQFYAEFSEFFINLENTLRFYNPTVSGFTIERMLYSLNPNLPCLSHNLGGHYVTTIPELLTVLNNITVNNPQAQIVDKHITGFIACKLNLKRELKIPSLKNYPQIALHPAILALSNIFLAHQQAGSINVNNIGTVLADRLVELFNQYIHNTRLKNLLKKDLINAGAVGDFGQLINIISDSKLIESDASGFKMACKEVTLINNKITALSNRTNVTELGVFFGQRFTVLFSYMMIVLVCVILTF